MSGRPDRTRSNAQLNQKGEVNWKLWALGIGFLLFLIVVVVAFVWLLVAASAGLL